jgi:hypothetical protein
VASWCWLLWDLPEAFLFLAPFGHSGWGVGEFQARLARGALSRFLNLPIIWRLSFCHFFFRLLPAPINLDSRKRESSNNTTNGFCISLLKTWRDLVEKRYNIMIFNRWYPVKSFLKAINPSTVTSFFFHSGQFRCGFEEVQAQEKEGKRLAEITWHHDNASHRWRHDQILQILWNNIWLIISHEQTIIILLNRTSVILTVGES